jgi:hypothetical protein
MGQWFGTLRRALAALIHRDRLDRELEEEMRSHLELQAEENRDAGMADAEARLAARRQFGNAALLKEESRGVWGWRWLEVLAQDLRFALRLMRRNPSFAAAAVLTLGLAIGGNTLVFSLVEAVVLRPLPFAEPARLFLLNTIEAASHRAMNSSYPDFLDWQEQGRTFQAMAAYRNGAFNLTGGAGPERVDSLDSTPGLFDVLGIQPVLGRPFTAADGDRVVLLSYGLWTRRFHGDRTVLGRTAQLDGHPYTILGVLPDGFHFPPRRFRGEPEVFVPLIPSLDRTTWSLQAIGRLRRGATEPQARVEMNGIARRLAEAYPERQRQEGVEVTPLEREVVADSSRTSAMLMGAVGFVLLIACANVANLLASQGAAAGDFHPHGHRRQPRARGAPVADRKRAAGGVRSGRGRATDPVRAAADGEPGAGADFLLHAGSRLRGAHRSRGAGVHRGGIAGGRGVLRGAAGAALHGARRHRPLRQAGPLARRADCARSRAGVHPAGRRGIDDEQHVAAAVGRSWLSPRPLADHGNRAPQGEVSQSEIAVGFLRPGDRPRRQAARSDFGGRHRRSSADPRVLHQPGGSSGRHR